MSTTPQPLAGEGSLLQSASPSEVAEYIEDMLSGMEMLANRSRFERLREILLQARAEARKIATN